MYLYIFADCTMLFKIFIHILYIQIILYKEYLAKQTVELSGYVNMSKSLNKITIDTKKVMAVASLQ